jgi:hypothetical protein
MVTEDLRSNFSGRAHDNQDLIPWTIFPEVQTEVEAKEPHFVSILPGRQHGLLLMLCVRGVDDLVIKSDDHGPLMWYSGDAGSLTYGAAVALCHKHPGICGIAEVVVPPSVASDTARVIVTGFVDSHGMKHVPGHFRIGGYNEYTSLLPSVAPWTERGLLHAVLARPVQGRLLYQVTVMQLAVAQALRDLIHVHIWDYPPSRPCGAELHRWSSDNWDVRFSGVLLNFTSTPMKSMGYSESFELTRHVDTAGLEYFVLDSTRPLRPTVRT